MVGSNTVTLTVTDNNGNVSTCTSTVTVEDNVAPECITQDITISLDAFGSISITPSDIDGGTSDACGIASLAIDNDLFDCSNVGPNTVTLTATDNNGNVSTCTATVTIEDNTPPVALCQDITIELDTDGTATIGPAAIDNVSTDACGIVDYAVSLDAFDCTNLGGNTVTLTVTDANGNSSSCNAIVTVEDNINPTILCPDDQNVFFDDNCAFELLDYTALATPDDNCANPPLVTQNPAAGTIITGTTLITLTADDGNGQTASCFFSVIPTDNIIPDITCPGDQMPGFDDNCEFMLLDYTGLATVMDNCSDAMDITVTQDPPAMTTILTLTTVTLTATDEAGNSNTCTFEVDPMDNTMPMIACPGDQNVSLTVDCNFEVEDYTGLAMVMDNCNSPAEITLTQTPPEGTIITGQTTITILAEDQNGNTMDCSFELIPADTTPPEVSCNDLDLIIGADGTVSITVNDVINTVSDNCGIASTEIDMNTFTCAEVGINTVLVTVTDLSGNVSNCTSNVSVTYDVMVDAGPDQVICETEFAFLDASISGVAAGGTWSGGTGNFNNVNSPNALYDPGPGEENTTVVLTWTSFDIDGAGPCEPVSDIVNVTVNSNPEPSVVCPPGNLERCSGEWDCMFEDLNPITSANGSEVVPIITGTAVPYFVDLQQGIFEPSLAPAGVPLTFTLTYVDPFTGCSASASCTFTIFIDNPASGGGF